MCAQEEKEEEEEEKHYASEPDSAHSILCAVKLWHNEPTAVVLMEPIGHIMLVTFRLILAFFLRM